MIIIIEGIDRVGKTTLANKISNEFNIPILKQERIGGNNQSDNDNALINYGSIIGLINFLNNDFFKDNLIIDRFHWTEAVYSLINRNNKNPMLKIPTIETCMEKQHDKYLIIQVQPVDINWSIRQHGSDLLKHQKEFDKLYEKCKLNKYCCTFFSFDMCLKEIGRRMKNDEV